MGSGSGFVFRFGKEATYDPPTMSSPVPDLPFVHTILEKEEWVSRRRAHRAKFEPRILEQVARRERGRPDPTMDFLFQYYGFPSGRFLRWTPGFGVLLEGAPAEKLLEDDRYRLHRDGVYLDLERLRPRERSLRWIHQLLEATAARPPFFGCHGLHEWALVHESELLHPSFPLRVDREAIAAHLEHAGVRCTHYDAFRFFSSASKALADHQLTDESMLTHEQPGCLHTNMDLYRWASKIAPWGPSELIGRALELAWEARRFDSAASPYDLSSTGLGPCRVETPEGKRDFVAAQERIWMTSIGIRADLIAEIEHILFWISERPSEE